MQSFCFLLNTVGGNSRLAMGYEKMRGRCLSCVAKHHVDERVNPFSTKTGAVRRKFRDFRDLQKLGSSNIYS